MAGDVYYPSLIANFLIRFDEAFHVQESPSPTSTDELTKGLGGITTQPRASFKPLFNAGATAVASGEAAHNVQSIIFNRIPKSASIELTGFRQANTFKMTFDYRDLPIDPRLVRSASVDIHLGAVPAADFGEGMVGVESNGGRKSVIAATRENLVLTGIVDTWHVNHSGGSSIIDVEGRDLRAIFLDSPLPGGWEKKINLNKPLDDVIKQILNIHPRAGEMNIVVQPDDWEGVQEATQVTPLVKPATRLPHPVAQDLIPRHRQGAQGKSTMSTPPSAPDQMNFWDLITKLCFLVGAVPFLIGSRLIIRPVRSLYDQQKGGVDPNVKTPFKDGKQRTKDGQTFSVRKMVYGRDVEDMTFERKYTGFKPKLVKCVSLDTSSTKRGGDKLIEVIYPNQEDLQKLIAVRLGNTPDAQKLAKTQSQSTFAKLKKQKTTSVSASGRESEEEILNIPVHGITDKTRLYEIARSVYEEIGRNEMSGSIKTRSLASFGGSNQDPDLLRLAPGDGMELEIDTRELSDSAPLVSFLIESMRNSKNQRIAEVEKRFGKDSPLADRNIAQVVVAQAQGSIVELQRFFRVKNVKYDWSNTSGISIAFDYHNYVTARNEVTPSTGQNQNQPKISPSTGNKVLSGVGL